MLPNDVYVNITQPGLYDAPGDLTSGNITADTFVNTYFLHGDKKQCPSGVLALSGTITFDTAVLGILVKADDLNNTHAMLGAPGTLYAGDGYSGLGLGTCSDRVRLSADRRTVEIDPFLIKYSYGRDTVRVITAVPEPATISMLCLGAAALLRRRRSYSRHTAG